MRSTDLDTGAADAPDPSRPMTGIVFRSVRSPSDREEAGRLLADSGVPPAAIRGSGDTGLYGLWDLAAQTGEGLVGVAATRSLADAGAGSVELCGIAIRAGLRRRGLGRRLVTEVADALRAEGAARLVARLEDDHAPAATLLTRAGFLVVTDGDGQSARLGAGWSYLAL